MVDMDTNRSIGGLEKETIHGDFVGTSRGPRSQKLEDCLDGHGWSDKIVPVLEPWLRCRPPLAALTKAARRIADDFIRFGRDGAH